MQTLTDKFEVGKVNNIEVNKTFPFEYRKFDNWAEVNSSADWSEKSLLELVNSYEKSAAKAKEYQEQTKQYRPDTSTPEYKREQTIKNLVDVFKIPRAFAEKQVDAMIASAKAEEATTA